MSVYSYKTKKGRTLWRGQVELPGEKRDKKTKAGFKLKREAEDWVAQMRVKLKSTAGIFTTENTLAEYLEWWMANKVHGELSPTTEHTYAACVKHLVAHLGTCKLTDLTAWMIEDVYTKLKDALNPKTIHNVHFALRAALRIAVKRKLLPYNPTDGCDLPKIPRSKKGALEADQLLAYVRAADGTWLAPIVRLAAATGGRMGEILALRWDDIDWIKGEITIQRAIIYTAETGTIEKSTKEGDVRLIILDPATLEFLKIHRQAQAEIAAMFGAGYKQKNLICAAMDGDWLCLSYTSHCVSELGRKLGLPHVGLHTFRHSHGSLLVAAGVNLADVAARLGHRDVQTTAKIYLHALPSGRERTARAWEGVLKQ